MGNQEKQGIQYTGTLYSLLGTSCPHRLDRVHQYTLAHRRALDSLPDKDIQYKFR